VINLLTTSQKGFWDWEELSPWMKSKAPGPSLKDGLWDGKWSSDMGLRGSARKRVT